MSLQEAVIVWQESAEEDWVVAVELLKLKKYTHSLFLVQQALEKLMKANHIKKLDSHPLFVHNLVLLAQKAELNLSTEELEQLKEISGFNTSARYDSYKREFYQKADADYTQKWFKIAETFRAKFLDLLK